MFFVLCLAERFGWRNSFKQRNVFGSKNVLSGVAFLTGETLLAGGTIRLDFFSAMWILFGCFLFWFSYVPRSVFISAFSIQP